MKNFKSNSKSAKGFYTALGISAVMVGAACYFAYSSDANKAKVTSPEKTVETPVDNKQPNVPKETAAPQTTTVTVVTTQREIPVLDVEIITVPVAEPVIVDVPAKAETVTVYKQPLGDISEIINEFSGKELVKNATTGSWQTHNGVDIAASIGDEVSVISGGEVISVENDALWGTVVTVDHHNGYVSRYCGLAKDLFVQPGQVLIAGDILGALGDTCDIESALATHLHLEVKQNGEYVDPMALIKY